MIALHDSMSLGRFRFLENNGSPDWAEFSLIERSKDSPERGPDGDSRTPPPAPPGFAAESSGQRGFHRLWRRLQPGGEVAQERCFIG